MKTIEKRTDLRVTRTQKLLTTALITLLCEQGQLFSHITVNEICDKAMVHRTTFYKHFEDKFALLSSTVTLLLQDYLQMNVDDRLRQPMQSIATILSDNVLETMVQNQMKDEGFNHFFRKYIEEVFKQDFMELKNRGKQFSLPLELAVEFHSGVISLLVNWWIHHFDENITAEQMDEYYYLLVNEKILLK